MRHLPIKQYAFVLLLSLAILVAATVPAIEDAASQPILRLPEQKVPSFFQRMRKSKLNRIFASDNKPLGDRTPVVLLPGRNEEVMFPSWWKKINRYARQHPTFNDHYKLYLFLYDSKKPIQHQTEALIAELKHYFISETENPPLIFVGYSLGGLMAKGVLQDPELNPRVESVIAVSTPFHGSPIFSRGWFLKDSSPPNRSPIRKHWDNLIYRTYMAGKRHLTDNLHWNNFDRSQYWFDLSEVAMESEPNELLHEKVPETVLVSPPEACLPVKEKIIVHASYMENRYNNPNYKKPLPSRVLMLPGQVLSWVFPTSMRSTHAVFDYINLQIAELPTVTPDHPHDKRRLYRFKYNDGGVPLSSMLFLPERTEPYSGELDEFVQALDVQQARIFKNINHMDFGEYRRTKHRLRTIDILSPEEGARTPLQWILYDLEKMALTKAQPDQENLVSPNDDEIALPTLAGATETEDPTCKLSERLWDSLETPDPALTDQSEQVLVWEESGEPQAKAEEQ